MYWGTTAVDITVPAEIPVAVLLPSVIDILGVDHPDREAARYRLSIPGASGLDPSMTLAQQDIGDGAILVLSRRSAPLPAPRYFDVAETVSATLDAATAPGSGASRAHAVRLIGAAAAMLFTGIGGLAIVRDAFGTIADRDVAATVTALVSAGALALGLAAIAHRGYRDPTAGLALNLIATAFAAVAGFVAVPGAPGAPNVLLAAAVAAVTAVVAMRVSDCGVVTLTAVAGCATVVAVAGLVGVVSAAPLHVVASVAALISIGLLPVAARASIALAGLSPRLEMSDAPAIEPRYARTRSQAVRADRWLTSLLAGLSVSAALAAIVTVVAGAPRLSCTAFGTLTGALLLLRSRYTDMRRMLVFAVGGIAVAATTFGVAASGATVSGAWVVTLTALTAAVAAYLGFVGAARPASPVLRRGAGLLEWLALAAMVPLTCWICGLYGASRGLNLT
ncbi:type VII secretion integral membrane protein EccD [Mycobacterium colombiense]|uniref:Type VII secretion integral membrane protein EccD n=1 Tax=Mycobacterium colombiense TaxID=339268 RepID=A0A1A2YAB9_9MYCO|nr:type VII secretion integral membrane protein EccD [Mycobacterium colombiense]